MAEMILYEDACNSIKIDIKPGVAIYSENVQYDSNSRYMTWTDLAFSGIVKVILEIIEPDQNYDGYIVKRLSTATSQILSDVDQSLGTFTIATETTTSFLGNYCNGKYKRQEFGSETIEPGDGSVQSNNYIDYISTISRWDYDENDEWVEFVSEVLGDRVAVNGTSTSAPQDVFGQPVTLTATFTSNSLGIYTYSGCPIDPVTGEVKPGYRIKVLDAANPDFALDQWDVSADPRAVTVTCLTQECPNGCIPLWDANLESRMCICQPVNGVPVRDEFPNLDQLERTWNV